MKSVDEAKAKQLDAFVEGYTRSANDHPKIAKALQVAQAPRYFWHAGEGLIYHYQTPIRRVEVRQVLTFFDGEAVHRVRDGVVRRIAIDPESRAE